MTRRLRRALLALTVVCAVLTGLVLGGSAWVVWRGHDRVLTAEDAPDAPYDCILVLGCAVYADGSPTPMLDDRIHAGAALYARGWSGTVLMSGDNRAEDYNEVGTMRAVAERLGVPAGAIVCDGAGLSTYDSLYRARDVYGARRIVVVTQQYHLYRALYLARSLGLDAWGVPAADVRYAGQLLRDVREIAARDKALIWSVLQPLPAVLD